MLGSGELPASYWYTTFCGALARFFPKSGGLT
jgi:hypothetical protein